MEFEKLQGIIAEVLNIEPEEVTMAATFVAVSYTHLDVYKRQRHPLPRLRIKYLACLCRQ